MQNAGYEIIKKEYYMDDFAIVLGRKETKYGEQYVTWDSKPLDNHFFWGHYFNNEIDALADYHTRLLSYYNARKE